MGMTNKIPCSYAIIRFRPYVETGEFANVGVLLFSEKARFFDFKVLKRRHSRITRFFHELDPASFRFSVKILEGELKRIRSLLKSFAYDKRRTYTDDHVKFAEDIVQELVRVRESTLVFSETRVVLADEPKVKLEDLFAYYVERNFVTKQYRETVLENNLRTAFRSAHILGRYERRTLGDEEFKVTIPFVEQESDTPRLIKPLNLGQETSTKILEHGANWQFKINELHERERINLDRVLFATEGPTSRMGTTRGKAFARSCGMLEAMGVQVLPIKDEGKIVEFASV
jgi:hypothetical protein